VAHCGESMSGSFAHTLVLTDIASGWTECIALLVRDAGLVVDALEHVYSLLPFRIRGVDTDNGGEFINDALSTFCTHHAIEFTRSRPYHKNDQAWVEQKNGSVVRRWSATGDWRDCRSPSAWSPLLGVPSVRQLLPAVLQAGREAARRRPRSERYSAPETPCARLLASDSIDVPMKDGSARSWGRSTPPTSR